MDKERKAGGLAEWLFYRFNLDATKGDDGFAWRELTDDDRAYWQHEADAVQRAVERGGFKDG